MVIRHNIWKSNAEVFVQRRCFIFTQNTRVFGWSETSSFVCLCKTVKNYSTKQLLIIPRVISYQLIAIRLLNANSNNNNNNNSIFRFGWNADGRVGSRCGLTNETKKKSTSSSSPKICQLYECKPLPSHSSSLPISFQLFFFFFR